MIITLDIFILSILVAIGVGFLIGVPITLRIFKAGTLVIDVSDPDKDRYSFELSTPLDDLPKQTFISLRVRLTDTLPESYGTNAVDIEKYLRPPYPDELEGRR